MKVDKGFVIELKREVNFQLYRLRRQINLNGASDGLLQSLYRLGKLKELLNGLLEDGEVVLVDCVHLMQDDNKRKQSWLQRWLRAVIRDEGD